MKIALVTGGSRGIGAAIVKKFATEGYTVILNYNKSEGCAQELQRQLASAGCDVHLARADISRCEEVSSMFQFIRKYFKHLDVLVNNAGVCNYSLCQDVSENDYEKVMDVNAKGTFFCCQQAAKMFVNQGYGGIVNVSSIWGLFGSACESVYSMSKHAVVGLTKSLAKELRDSNVRVNCVCPPIVLTDMCSDFSQEEVQEFCNENDVNVFTAEQVADDVFGLAISNDTGIILQER